MLSLLIRSMWGASNEWSSGQGLAHNGSMGTRDLPGGDSSVSKYIIRIDMLGKCRNTHIKSLAYKVRAIIVEKAKKEEFHTAQSQPRQDSK